VFKSCEEPAFVVLVVIDEFGIGPLRPIARAEIDFVRKGARRGVESKPTKLV